MKLAITKAQIKSKAGYLHFALLGFSIGRNAFALHLLGISIIVKMEDAKSEIDNPKSEI